MLRTSWLLLLYLAFLGLGVTTPFVMTLGYVWVDLFQPQSVAYFILNELPIAFIMGAGAVASYLLLDRRSPPPVMLPNVLQVMMAIWMTATLLWAEVPDAAIDKWNVFFKAMVFAAFVPLVIRSRVQIEAFAQTFVFSLAANFVPFGLKVLLSGGGYGTNLGLEGGNSNLGEGGQLSTFCLMAVPLTLFLGKHGQLIPKLPLMNVAYFGVALLAVVTAIGTYERSALVGLVFMGFYMFLRSRNKVWYAVLGGVVAIVVIGMAARSWEERISTIQDYSGDSSAMTRVLIWKWTLGYVETHPLGGSFGASNISTIMMPPDEANPGGWIQTGRAFHSIYFEVLGELGYPGIAIFLLAIGSTFFSLLRLSRKCRKIPDLVWVADMADALQSGMMAFLTAGAFVGIAFQPPFWYFVSLGVSLRAYVYHAERADAGEASGWRLLAQRRREEMAALSSSVRPRPPVLRGEEARAGTPVWRRAVPVRRGRP